MLDCQRHLFDVPEDVCYLNSAYMAPRLKGVTRAAYLATERGKAPWSITPPDFFEDVERLRGMFARLIDAGADDIALVPSVSYGTGIAAANLDVSRGQRVVVLAEQFPSNVYCWRDLTFQRGARLVTVTRPPEGDWTPGVLREIDHETAVVALPQAHWTDGSALDLDSIGKRCRETGAALVLDLTQSLGAVPFSVGRTRPDFAVAAAYKWLLGPYSLAFLYVSPDRQRGRPLEQAWMSRKNSRNFAGLVDYQDEYRAGARRFDVGEHSNFQLLPMATAALRQILAWEVPQIAGRLADLTDHIAQRAAALGFQAPAREARSPHMLGLRLPHDVTNDLIEAFAKARVFVSLRGNSIRIAPHLHVNEQDIERFFAVLEKYAP